MSIFATALGNSRAVRIDDEEKIYHGDLPRRHGEEWEEDISLPEVIEVAIGGASEHSSEFT